MKKTGLIIIAKIAVKNHIFVGWLAGAGVDYAATDNGVIRLG